jgi:hypothetical protein
VSSPDKTQHIRQNPPLDAQVKCWEDQHFRDRWSTLLSVDEIVQTVVDKLTALKILDKVYTIHTVLTVLTIHTVLAILTILTIIPRTHHHTPYSPSYTVLNITHRTQTFIFYSSDHGYKQGQWRVGTSKQHPYETDIHVPFLARGPGIEAGSKHAPVAGNVDITPTILALAGVAVPPFMDGKSLLPFLLPGLR